MSDVTSVNQPAKPNRPFVAVSRVILWGCLLVALGFLGRAYFFGYRPAVSSQQLADEATVHAAGLITPVPKHLAAQFTDVRDRLLADPPSSPDQLIDPAVIVMGHWEGDSDNPDINWTQFEKHLADSTSRTVKDLKFDNSPEQIDQIKKGQITVVALHAADAPFLVNSCGYQPVAVLVNNTGSVNGNHCDLIVPSDSSITSPADLRGHNLTCTVPSSVTGYRAAIALLMEDQGLRPDVDYNITWSLKQKASITGVAKGQYQAASVSDDKLQDYLKSGKIQQSQFRMIFQSEPIPRMTIGWFYNLKPELAAKIRDAILSFMPQPAAADQDDNDSIDQTMHWAPANYKEDFKLVRLIDDSFDPRLNTKATK